MSKVGELTMPMEHSSAITPLVSVVTVTKGRRAFFPNLIASITTQDVGLENIEWILVDEGNDPVLDCVSYLPFLRYHYSRSFNTLGEKRNYSNSLVRGEYVAYFDDDNYAFPSRLSKSIDLLRINPEADLVGSSEMYVFDNDLKQAYVCGPFGKNHATLGTWCFRRSLLSRARFDDAAISGEEVAFTKNWSLTIAQIGKDDANVCFDHGSNTVSKKHLLEEAHELMPLEAIVDSPEVCAFFATYPKATRSAF